MYVPDNAPPFALYRAPYGGLGLKTRSYAKALARIEGLLASSTDVFLESVELSVGEPSSRELAESVLGPLSPLTSGSAGGGGPIGDAAARLATFEHTHDALAADAWQRFGSPNRIGARQQRGGPYFVEWLWHVDDPILATHELAAWTPWVSANEQGVFDDDSTLVHVRAIWEMRLQVAKGRVVTHPFPKSRVHASLRGKQATAFLELVLPHEAATDAFLADYQAVNKALGMTVPMKGYKLCASKKGGGRVYKKLPGL